MEKGGKKSKQLTIAFKEYNNAPLERISLDQLKDVLMPRLNNICLRSSIYNCALYVYF